MYIIINTEHPHTQNLTLPAELGGQMKNSDKRKTDRGPEKAGKHV